MWTRTAARGLGSVSAPLAEQRPRHSVCPLPAQRRGVKLAGVAGRRHRLSSCARNQCGRASSHEERRHADADGAIGRAPLLAAKLAIFVLHLYAAGR